MQKTRQEGGGDRKEINKAETKRGDRKEGILSIEFPEDGDRMLFYTDRQAPGVPNDEGWFDLVVL